MNKMIFSVVFLGLIGGCASDSSGPYSKGGWNSLYPPQADALGPSILEFKGGVHLGDHVKHVKPSQIEYRDSLQSYSQTDLDNFKAGLELAIKGVAAAISYDVNGSSTKIGNNLKVAKVKDVIMVNEENRWFVYQCIIAASYEFSAKSKSSTNIGVDAAKSEWAKALGMDKASVGVSSNPVSPDEMKITVANPNVCLSYLAAKFVPDDPWINKPEANYITADTESGKSLANFTLGVGEESRERTADIKGQRETSKTLYWLRVAKADDSLQMQVCKKYRGLGSIADGEKESSKEDCSQTLAESSTGRWRGPQIIGIEKPTDYDLVLIVLNLDARVVASDSVRITEPRINVSRYKIKYK